MKKADWSSFEERVIIDAPLADIFQAWNTSKGLCTWFLRSAAFYNSAGILRSDEEAVQKGDALVWHWHGYPDEVFERRQILSTNHTNKIEFSFTGSSKVSVEISELATLHLLSLKQTGIANEPDPQKNLRIQCARGWLYYLMNLKSVLEGGLDLRIKSEKLQNVMRNC